MRTRLAIAAVGGAALVLGGCESDSFLFDQSIIGRWEHTPTTVPILTRIASIEGQDEYAIDFSDPSEADLVPEVVEYRIGPGDQLLVTIWDLPDEGRSIDYPRVVDPRGFIDLPQIGQVYVNGKNTAGAEEALREAMKPLITRPVAAINITGKRTDRYAVIGAVQNPAQYSIQTANFKLLEALSASGTFSEAPEYIYVIRQVPLTEAASGKPNPAKPATPEGTPPEKPSGEQLIDTLKRLNEEPKPEQPKQEPPKQPANPPKPGGSPGMFQPPTQPPANQQPPKPARNQEPPIPLIPKADEKPKPASQPPAQPESGETAWVNIDGKWVKVAKPAAKAGGVAPTPSPLGRPSAGEQMVTQRIIRIPTARLMAGDARVNIVIRAGDVIRVPPNPSGTIYVAGQITRPGAYGVAEGITLTRIIPAAGGLSGLGVPERVDLVRMVGPERQATIRLNLRAIQEGTNPDIFLKSNDMVNIGTTWWAMPLAVIRNGFRASYGFGLVADRNFGNDIFGAPPTNQFGQ
jgi:protein involved in polysaccharide export with SLBB domain